MIPANFPYLSLAIWLPIAAGVLILLVGSDRRAPLVRLLALVGSINVPIIYFSVQWWNTLHQGATISVSAAPKMAATMLTAMLLMTVAFWAYAFAVVFMRTRAHIIERDAHAGWVAALVRGRIAG